MSKSNNNTETDGDFYPGRAALVKYLTESNPEDWSYIDFLTLNSVILIDIPPFLDSWNALDGTWTRRFLREVIEIDRDLYKDIKNKVISFQLNCGKGTPDQLPPDSGVDLEHADLTICHFWEEVISKRNRLKLRKDLDAETSLNLIPSDESGDDDPSLTLVNDDEDDENDNVPDPNEIPDLSPSNLQGWSLPSGRSVEDIFAMNVSINSKAYRQKKKQTSIEKATLRYSASKIIDLSAHMRAWFSPTDRQFMTKNYETLLTVPELPDDVNTFILEVEEMVRQGNSDAAFKLCIENYVSSPINSCISKFNGNDMLECDSIGHTEVDIIVKTFSYIVDGGESFCPLSKSTSYTKGRKCDVRFLSSSGMDLGEWEFSVRATANKTISDRCRSGRINQSILNGLLRLDWKDEQIKLVKVPFVQFAGVNGQMLIEVLMNGFYIIFPGPKFQLPTKLAQIEKLKTTVKVTKYIMV
ncbi:28342_t:CDS:2 [Racocetra persica]|uniref:28342_t:CDS:1 n=1 Tax=Racocetra persica TaxID=160502 RepID=A0ACA9LN36_9GLOM|nr:28342_t:CDS:2 [Racocetra persica]